MTTLTHLQRLEAESIDIMREAVAECERPVMLYSIGKDSSVMLHLVDYCPPGVVVHDEPRPQSGFGADRGRAQYLLGVK